MSGVLENAARLSQVIGARPAGTEEEQQASFIIEDQLKTTGLETTMEEITCNPNYELPRIICCGVSLICAVLAAFLPLMVIPALIICAIMAVLYVMENLGVSPLNNTAKRGLSQNVVAVYTPGIEGSEGGSTGSILPLDENGEVDAASAEAAGRSRASQKSGRAKGARKRKIVVLARYDSGKVCAELKPPFFKYLYIIRWVEIGAIVAIPVLLLLRMLTNAEGVLLIFWNVLMLACAVVVLLPVIRYVVHQTSAFTDGANNNAAGVAVMLEVAKRIAASAEEPILANATVVAAAETEEDGGRTIALAEGEEARTIPVMHGEEAVRASGMLPVDVDLVYQEAAEGTLRGVEAEAAQAEKLVQDGVIPQSPIPDSLAGAAASGAAAGIVGAGTIGAAAAADSAVASAAASIESNAASFLQSSARTSSKPSTPSNVPDWFKKGIEAANANKEASGAEPEPQAQRSRFADALDAAAVASANSIQEFENRDSASSQGETTASGISEERLRQVRESILNGKSNMAAQAEVAAVAAEKAASEAEAAAKAAADAAAAKAAIATGDNLTPEEAVAHAGSTLKADVAAAIGAQQAAEAAATAQAVEEVAEQAAVADRTISYIPVAAEIPADISAVEIGETSAADSVAKSASEILEEVAAVAGEDVASSGVSKEGGRRKRSISLPSLTGAIEAMNEKQQDAPLGEDAEREVGESRAAVISGSRRRRTGLDGLPSTDLPSKGAKAAEEVSETAVSVASNKEGSTTSFLAATGEKDAAAALSSLDAPVEPPKATPMPGAGKAEPIVPKPLEQISADVAADIETATDAPVAVSAAGSFVQPSATSQFAPVGDELIANMVEDDIIVEDVDDSDYTDNITHTGAMAGPGYVEMPKSRGERFRSIFGRKKKQNDSISFSEAVGLEEGFDARQVGAARGGWESFQNESADYEAGATFPETAPATAPVDSPAKGRSGQRRSHIDEYSTNSRSLRFKNREEDWGGDAWSDDDWNGGAFSLKRKGSADGGDGADGHASRRGARGSKGARPSSGQRRRSQEEISSARRSREGGAADGGEIAAADMLEEREQIRSFRTSSAPLASFEEVAAYAGTFSADIADAAGEGQESAQIQPMGFQTEVWFVALGAELADNAGIKAFLNTHSDDMRGAIIIDLDALGAGDLSLVDEEGTLKPVKASSRMKRYVTKAGTALGLRVNSVKMRWRESAAYIAASRGLQTIHVAGFLDGKPAYQGEESDKFENLSEEKMLENTAFVLELLNNI